MRAICFIGLLIGLAGCNDPVEQATVTPIGESAPAPSGQELAPGVPVEAQSGDTSQIPRKR